MLKKINRWMIFGICVFVASASVSAQEDEDIEIVDVNGRKVEVIQDKDAEKVANFKIDGDKIIIIDAEGNKKEIDISGARSVSVQQSVQSRDENGEKSTVTKGKAIIIGPDGKRHEIELGGPLELSGEDGLMIFDGNFAELVPEFPPVPGIPGLPGHFRAEIGQVGKYMIGINSQPVPDSLRAHLDLEEGVGLLVQSVSEDGPAKEAGIQKHDILLQVGEDTQLSDLKTLIEAVQIAGKEDAKVVIVGIRRGKEKRFEVKPMERPAGQLFRAPIELQFDRLGPGVILNDDQEFRDQFEAMREHIQKIQRDLEKLRAGDKRDQ